MERSKPDYDENGRIIPGCITCKHYTGGAFCAVFPEGIPILILNGQLSHLEPFPGDHGMQFEPMDDPDGPPDYILELMKQRQA